MTLERLKFEIDRFRHMHQNGQINDLVYGEKLGELLEKMMSVVDFEMQNITGLVKEPLRMWWFGFMMGAIVTPIAILFAIHLYKIWSA